MSNDGTEAATLEAGLSAALALLDRQELNKLEYLRLSAELAAVRLTNRQCRAADLLEARQQDTSRQTFRRQVVTTLVDKAILAGLIVGATFLLNSRLEQQKTDAAARAEYKKRQLEAAESAERAAMGLYQLAMDTCNDLKKQGETPDRGKTDELSRKARAQIHATTMQLQASSAYLPRELLEPANGMANGSLEFLAACLGTDEQKKANVSYQMCRLQVHLRYGIASIAADQQVPQQARDSEVAKNCGR